MVRIDGDGPSLKAVQLAYRNLCDGCAKKKKLCPGCNKPPELAELAEGEGAPEEDEARRVAREGRDGIVGGGIIRGCLCSHAHDTFSL